MKPTLVNGKPAFTMQTSPANDALKLIKSLTSGDPTPSRSGLEAKARIRFGIAQALVQGRMSFHFQPIVRADAPHYPAFYEMLARMRTPDGQILSAGAFMPQVEDGPLGRIIDRFALSEALRALAENPRLRLSVNMSPLSMGDEEWLGILAAAHRGGSGVCGRLILEVTEQAALADAGQMIEFMAHVRRMGPAFALDDFGAGATGFRHFRDFRFDIVKIDGSFVHGVHASPDQQVLLGCLATLARHFEMMTVAEHVETEADAAWLNGAGIDCLQGYLYGRAEPAAEMTRRPTSAPLRGRAVGTPRFVVLEHSQTRLQLILARFSGQQAVQPASQPLKEDPVPTCPPGGGVSRARSSAIGCARSVRRSAV